MLQTVDVLIGFAVVMLVLSAIVTMLVQWISTTLVNLKGQTLKGGIARLLLLLDKDGLFVEEARAIADHVLRHILVGKKMVFSHKRALAGVIHREELVELVLDFAANADLDKADELVRNKPEAFDRKTHGDEAHLRARLLNSLRNNGVVDSPKDILVAVRNTMMELERDRPELASDARQSIALLTHASSEFLAKLDAWFDQTIDRTVESFTTRTRIWTVLLSLVVAVFFQVDSFLLIQRLSTDKAATAVLVNAAIEHPDSFASLSKSPGIASSGGSAAAPASGATKPDFNSAQALENIRDNPELKQIVDTNLIAWPSDFHAWAKQWSPRGADGTINFYALLTHVGGVLLTMGLLALGAPVWYEILKNLIQLRSVVARKDDAQRTARQTSQPVVDASS